MLISASHCASERVVCDMHMQQGGHMLTEEKATASMIMIEAQINVLIDTNSMS